MILNVKTSVGQYDIVINRGVLKGLKEYLNLDKKGDTFYPEDWISSFVEAKNKNYVKDEGITRVLVDGEEKLITQVVTSDDFGEGRKDSGVLIKFLIEENRNYKMVDRAKDNLLKLGMFVDYDNQYIIFENKMVAFYGLQKEKVCNNEDLEKTEQDQNHYPAIDETNKINCIQSN